MILLVIIPSPTVYLAMRIKGKGFLINKHYTTSVIQVFINILLSE